MTSKDELWRFVCLLPANTMVNIEEIDGMSCRISAPHKGWISFKNVDIYKTMQKSVNGYIGRVSNFFDKQWLKPC